MNFHSVRRLIVSEWLLIVMFLTVFGTLVNGVITHRTDESRLASDQSTAFSVPSEKGPEDIFSQQRRIERSEMIKEKSSAMFKSGQIPLMLKISACLAFAIFMTGLLSWTIRPRFLEIRHQTSCGTDGLQNKFPVYFSDLLAALISLLFFDVVVSFTAKFFSVQIGQGAGLFLITLFRSIMVFCYMALRLKIRRGISLRDFGYSGNQLTGQILNGFLAYCRVVPIYVISAVSVGLIFSWIGQDIPVQTPIEALYNESHRGVLILSAFFVAVAGPFFEEFIFRGVVYRSLKSVPMKYFATIASSVVFSAFHAHLAAFVPIMVLSLALNALYDRTHSLIACGTLHAIHNSLMLMFVFGMKGMLG